MLLTTVFPYKTINDYSIYDQTGVSTMASTDVLTNEGISVRNHTQSNVDIYFFVEINKSTSPLIFKMVDFNESVFLFIQKICKC